MALAPYLVLDLVSAALVLAIAGAFFRAYWTLRGELPLLMSIGFGLLGVGILMVATSEFDLAGSPLAVDVLRLSAHTAAALVLAFAYLDARTSRARPWAVLAWAAAATGITVALLTPLVPDLSLDPRVEWAAAHTVQGAAYALCFVLSGSALLRRPAARGALVPLAFLAYAVSKYTWLLIDLTGDHGLVPFVYFWRFTMIGLLFAALLPAMRRSHAPA